MNNFKITAWINWTLAVAYVIAVFGFQTGYAVTGSEIAASLSLSKGHLGFVGSLYLFIFAFAQLFSGILLDKFGSKKVLPAAALIFTTGVFAAANAKGLNTLMLSQVLVALGGSFGFVGAGYVSSIWFAPEKFGIMFSMVQFVASSAAFLSQQLLSKFIARLPWRYVINTIGGATLLLSILLMLFLKNPKNMKIEKNLKQGFNAFIKDVFSSVIKLVQLKGMPRIMFIGGVSFGVMICMGAVWGPEIMRMKGALPATASMATSISWLGLALGAPVLAYLGNKNIKLYMSAGLSIQLVLIILFIVSNTTPHILTCTLFFIWGFGAGASMLPFVMGTSKAGAGHSGTSSALINGSQFLMGSFFISIPGFLMNYGVRGVGLLVVLPAFILIALLMTVLSNDLI